MHHRALGLLPSTPFSAILHAAAARAWVRSASRFSKRPKPLVKPPDIALVRYLQRNDEIISDANRKRVLMATSVTSGYFDPDLVNDYDLLSFSDPDRDTLNDVDHIEPPWHRHDSSILGTSVAPSDQNTRTSQFPLAKNAPSLYQNLLRLLRCYDPPPALPALMDYHDLHPDYRSMRSYNLLISLALRTASYGTVRWLLDSMRAANVPSNLETWKLRVRWLVQSGMWDVAWKEAMEISSRTSTRIQVDGKVRFNVTNALPLSIWIEFFRTLKHGTTRLRKRRKGMTTPPKSTAPLESNSLDLYSTRYHTLMNNRPTIIPHDLSKSPPKTIYYAVWVMLHVGQTDTALSLTKTYFARLPPLITVSWYRTCLDILHLHIAKGSSQTGLRRLYETRRNMVSLLSVYRTLRPTSTTLFLLLAPLYRAKRCGTVADNTVRAFKRQYGSRTEDRRVRRRVAILALKEGRNDIVDKMLLLERGARWAHATWRLTRRVFGTAAKPLPRRLLRPPTRIIFRRNGQEERRWCKLMKRVSRTRRHNRTK